MASCPKSFSLRPLRAYASSMNSTPPIAFSMTFWVLRAVCPT